MRRLNPPSVPTLGELRRSTAWMWVCCAGRGCTHHAPMAFAPLIIRWGAEASSDQLRQCARCSRCGHQGATLRHPSWINLEVGEQPFPSHFDARPYNVSSSGAGLLRA